MASLVESQLQYHKQAVQVLEELTDKLQDRYLISVCVWTSTIQLKMFVLIVTVCDLSHPLSCVCIRVNEAQSRPRREYTPKPKPSFDYGEPEHSNGGYSPTANPPSYSSGKIGP